MSRNSGVPSRAVRLAVLAAIVAITTTGCFYFPSTVRSEAGAGTAWWCAPDGGSTLGDAECRQLAVQLDAALAFAYEHPHAADAVAGGATGSAYEAGVGAAFRFSAPTSEFEPAQPDTLLYDGTGAGAQLAGIEWNVDADTAPAGFIGANDEWAGGGGIWTVRAWIVRPFENQPNVFAASHPCLGATAAVYDTADACYTTTHPHALRILVSNDDGYSAAGIDAVVEALRTVSGVTVTVVAPATDQSGTSDNTTPGGVTSFSDETLSGYPATAVNGFPADSVLHALRVLGENPDLVIAGINRGQNIGPLVEVSGTVGAARTAARNGIPALAASQGFGDPPDYASGAAEVLEWLEDFRLGRAGPPVEDVANLNIPTCTTGAIRGEARLPVATALNGRPIDPSNCTSTVTTFADDVDGFLNGFVTLSDVGK